MFLCPLLPLLLEVGLRGLGDQVNVGLLPRIVECFEMTEPLHRTSRGKKRQPQVPVRVVDLLHLADDELELLDGVVTIPLPADLIFD